MSSMLDVSGKGVVLLRFVGCLDRQLFAADTRHGAGGRGVHFGSDIFIELSYG
jgi:hypothetical protein